MGKEIYTELFTDYYDTLYREKNYRLECDHLQSIFCRHSGSISSILDMGCGTGEHTIELADRGYKVHGIDLSERLINIAKKKIESRENLTFEVADVRTYHSTPNLYSAIIAMFGVASYQLTRTDILRMFKTANRCLTTGGLFLFDFWNHNAVIQSSRPNGTLKELVVPDNGLGMKSIYKYTEVIPDGPASNLATINFVIFDVEKGKETIIIKDKHRQRFFSVQEITELLEETGFSIASVTGGNLGTTHIQSEGVNRLPWNISITARKETDRGW